MLSKGASRYTDPASAPGEDSGAGARSVNVELAVVSSGVDVNEVDLDDMGEPHATVGTTEAAFAEAASTEAASTEAASADAAEGAAVAAAEGSGTSVRAINRGGDIDTVKVGDGDLEISVRSTAASAEAAASALKTRWETQSGARMKGRMKDLRQAARAKAAGEDGTPDVNDVGFGTEYGSPPPSFCVCTENNCALNWQRGV